MAQARAKAATKMSPRKRQLVLAANQLFQTSGFDDVSMEDIANAVGVTGPALYRHFKSKQDVLAEVVLDQISVTHDAVRGAVDAEDDPDERLAAVIRNLGDLVVERGETMLWKWERRHLAPADVASFRQKARGTENLTASAVRAVRTDLDDAGVLLISGALLSALSHTGSYRRGSRGRTLNLLTRMSHAIVHCELSDDETRIAEGVTPQRPSGRRERVIEAATQLFWQRGYHAVSVEEISAEADVAIATIYQYFENKASLLYAILWRGTEGLNYVTTDRLAHVRGAQEALDGLLDQFIELSFGPHGRLFRIFDDEARHLPEPQQSQLRASERGHFEQWVATLCELRPELTALDARALSRTATGVISDVAQTAHLRRQPGIASSLRAISRAIVHS